MLGGYSIGEVIKQHKKGNHKILSNERMETPVVTLKICKCETG